MFGFGFFVFCIWSFVDWGLEFWSLGNQVWDSAWNFVFGVWGLEF